jgi:hypothetical protein
VGGVRVIKKYVCFTVEVVGVFYYYGFPVDAGMVNVDFFWLQFCKIFMPFWPWLSDNW